MIYGRPYFIGNSSIDHLIEVIKVLGTPTKTQVKEMNPEYDLKDYKFPNIKSKSLKKVNHSISFYSYFHKQIIYW